jgi:hypothetical protein
MKALRLNGLLCGLAALLLMTGTAHARCPGLSSDTLLDAHFESGLPEGWAAPQTSDGGAWQTGAGQIGPFLNPGSGAWIYVNDEQSDNIGRAVLTTRRFNSAGFTELLLLSFDLNFQRFGGAGSLYVELWDGTSWQRIYEEPEDYAGRIELDLTPFAGLASQIRFVYDDGDTWNWGAGLDRIVLEGRRPACGDGICGPGESPGTCPGDCPALASPAPGWISSGYDLEGKPAAWKSFKGGTECDDCSQLVELSFACTFYGTPYRQVWINSNGSLTFESEFLEYTPEAFCLGGPRMIAPFYADADLARGGTIRYYLDPAGHYLVVSWESVGYFGCETPCSLRNTFQVLLTDGSIRSVNGHVLPFRTQILFSYGEMQWTTGNSSGGTGGFGGSPATVGVNLGDDVICLDYGSFDRPGFEYLGNTQTDECPPNAVGHLSHRTLFLNDAGERLEPSGDIRLSASAAQGGVLLSWQTDLISTLRRFEVLRSADGVQFVPIGEIFPAPGAGGSGSYLFLDTRPLAGDNIYRVRSEPASGGAGAEAQISFRGGSSGPSEGMARSLAAWPVPMTYYVIGYYETDAAEAVRYLLSDMSGRVVAQGELAAVPGSTSFRIETAGLSDGLYVLAVQHPGGVLHQNLVKR